MQHPFSPYHPFRVFQVNPQTHDKLKFIKQYSESPLFRQKFPDGAAIDYFPIHIPPELFRTAQTHEDVMALSWKVVESHTESYRFYKYWTESRQVIAIDPTLGAALSHTDVDDVPWSEVHFPFNEFYISWGDALGQSYFIQDREYIVDGAYVHMFTKKSAVFPDGAIAIDFTSRRISPGYESNAIHPDPIMKMSDPVDYFMLAGEPSRTIGECYREGIKFYEDLMREKDKGLPNSVAGLAESLGFAHIKAEVAIQPNLKRFERTISRVLPAIPLLFNSLLYLSNRPEDVSEGFNTPPPANLLKRLSDPTIPESKKRKDQEYLDKKGYHRIKFLINPAFKDSAQRPNDGAPSSGIAVATHWRRGHWARQTYGPNGSLRKLIWRMPILVNADVGVINTGVVRTVEPRLSE